MRASNRPRELLSYAVFYSVQLTPAVGHGICPRQRASASAAVALGLRVKVGERVLQANVGDAKRLRNPNVAYGALEVVLHVGRSVSGLRSADEPAANLANDNGDEKERVALRSDRFADDVHVLHEDEGIRGVDVRVVRLHEDVALPGVVRGPQIVQRYSRALSLGAQATGKKQEKNGRQQTAHGERGDFYTPWIAMS